MCRALEPFRKLDSSSWIPSKDRFMEIYWNRQKASLWQEAMGNTETGSKAHTDTVETILVGQWECVSAYYSLRFQVSTFLGFIMWRMCCCRVSGVRSATQTEALFIPRLQSAQTPGEKEGEDSREMCWAILQFCVCASYSLPLSLATDFLVVLEMLERWMLQFCLQVFIYLFFFMCLGLQSRLK